MLQAAADATSMLLFDLGVLAGLWLLAKLLNPDRAIDRLIFGCAAGILLVTYGYWRWHDTLPPLELSGESLWSHLYFFFEAIAILYTLMSITILFRSVDRSEQASQAQSKLACSGQWPAVDIFICTYNEPLEVLEKSILSAKEIDYPNYTVWVLDDTRRNWLREYCTEAGIRYVTRTDNVGAKAGNLNNGLVVSASQTNAPIILVLDADFAPRHDILNRTVGLLDDPTVAIIQTPQFYFNPDAVQHNLMAESSWVDDQRFFFDCFQPAKDAWGCSFCVGTSFVVRRDRLEEIQGFPTGAVTEDLNLTYTLLAKGYRTWWLNEPLSRGLAAEGIAEYLTQRARWCLGTIQVGLLREGPLRGSGFKLVHRWHYIHSVLNWLCKPFIVMMLVAPSFYWLLALPAFQADYLSFLRYGMPALFAQLFYMSWVSRARTLPFFTEATHAIGAFAITATLFTALIKPFGRPFKVTDKGGDRSTSRIYGSLAWVFAAMTIGSFASILWAFVSPYAAGEISPADLFNLFWAAIAMFISFIAFVICFERPRSEIQFAVNQKGVISTETEMVPCRIQSMSTSNATLCDMARELHDDADLFVPKIGWISATVDTVRLGGANVSLRPSPEQYRKLVVALFSRAPVRVADRARMGGALFDLLQRGFAINRS